MATVKIGNKEHKINETLKVGDTFRLIGRNVEFEVDLAYMCLESIPVVRGISKDGKSMTTARVVDTCEVQGYEC